MTKYFLSESAKTDLINIWTYIADDDIDAADNVLSEIQSACEMLADSPGLGHSRKDLTSSGVRFWPVRNYLIIHHPSPSLEIVRVLSGFRDIINLLD